MGEYDIPVAIAGATAVTITAIVVTHSNGAILTAFFGFIGVLFGAAFARRTGNGTAATR